MDKWIKVVGMILLGCIASKAGETMGGVVGPITTIVGVILLVGGIVEIFKKQKVVKEDIKNK